MSGSAPHMDYSKAQAKSAAVFVVDILDFGLGIVVAVVFERLHLWMQVVAVVLVD